MSTEQWERDGNWIYELNSDGVNKWTCVVQRGQDDTGKRTSEEEIQRVVKLIKAAPALRNAAESMSQSINFRAATLCSGDQSKMDYADEKYWKCKDALDSAIAEATN